MDPNEMLSMAHRSDLFNILFGFLAAVIGAAVGGIASLLGVWMTVRNAQRIHENKLIEERKKILEQREFSAKQDALIAASEAVDRFIAYYLSLADRPFSADGKIAEEVIEMDVALNRLHFYCGLETIEQAVRLSSVLDNAVIEVIKAKMPSAFIAEDLRILDMRISGLEKMNMQIQGEVNAILQTGSNSSFISAHKKQIAENFGKIAELQGKKPELVKQKYIEMEKCRDIMSKNLLPIYEVARDVLLLARQELSFPIDQKKYQTVMDARLESMTKNIHEYLSFIRKQVLERMK